jgi:hypothetical protein
MTSISATTNQYAFTSPRDRLQNELTSEISAGTIKSADLDPLSAALDSIDETLKSQRESDQAAGSGPPSPDQMKSKIDDLIASQVSSGKLTSDQADELKNVFASAFASGPGGPGGPHGHHGGPGGPGGGAAGAQGSDTSDSDDTSSVDSNIQDLLASFLKTLQETMSQTKGYNANSQSQSQSLSAALIIDFQS